MHCDLVKVDLLMIQMHLHDRELEQEGIYGTEMRNIAIIGFGSSCGF